MNFPTFFPVSGVNSSIQDPECSVREAAAKALGCLGHDGLRAMDGLGEDVEVRVGGTETRSETMKKLKDHHFFGGYIGNIVGISWDIDIYHWDIMGIVWILFKPDDLMSRHHWNDGTCKQHLPSGNLT